MSAPAHCEIWWLEDEEIGRRPVLLLTRDSAKPLLTQLVVAPITRTVRGIPSELALGPDDGLAVSCAASFDNLRTVSRALLTGRAGALAPGRDHEMCAALAAALDC